MICLEQPLIHIITMFPSPITKQSLIHCTRKKNINRKIYMLMPPDMLFKKRCFVFYFCKVKYRINPKKKKKPKKKATLPYGRNVIGSPVSFNPIMQFGITQVLNRAYYYSTHSLGLHKATPCEDSHQAVEIEGVHHNQSSTNETKNKEVTHNHISWKTTLSHAKLNKKS